MADTTKTCIDLDTEALDRFREFYPQRGSIKWFFNEVLKCFVELHDPDNIPEEIRQSVNAVLSRRGADEEESE